MELSTTKITFLKLLQLWPEFLYILFHNYTNMKKESLDIAAKLSQTCRTFYFEIHKMFKGYSTICKISYLSKNIVNLFSFRLLQTIIEFKIEQKLMLQESYNYLYIPTIATNPPSKNGHLYAENNVFERLFPFYRFH